MNLETKLALVDAVHWTSCIERELRSIMTLADELDAQLREIGNPLLAIDASRIANKAATTIIRTHYVRDDHSKLNAQLDPTYPTTSD